MKYEMIIYTSGVLEYAIHTGLIYKSNYKMNFEIFITYLLVVFSIMNYIMLRKSFYQIMRIRARV